MRITIVYDNEVFKRGLRSSWGFSCLIQTDTENILFDVGGEDSILSFNMKRLGINPRSINKIILSHPHLDHTGGLSAILGANRELTLYLSKSFPHNFKAKLEGFVDFVEVDGPTQICTDVYSTGELGKSPKEQSLVLKSKEGNFVITGCAHPGIKSILSEAVKFGRVLGIVGGLHEFNEFDLLKDMRLICPCHCTLYKRKLATIFPEVCKECGVGKDIEL
jgi:7,8-dihydropterin-6-yl-methyl-4-(beta-D-ribofuranosyl)aminobenzene 5'-phosphate synthase